MTIAQLNAKYGAQGRIVFREGFAGFPNVVLANKYGWAEVALLGANVLSYRPTGHSPVIFCPQKKALADYDVGESFHGGIPVCWPQFGNRFSKDLPQHGFAQRMLFEVRGTEYTEEKTEVTLGLKPSDETRSIWPHDFDLEYKVSVTMKLNLELTTKNTGKTPFDLSYGFHPYFQVRERNPVTVRGLKGLDVMNGIANVMEHQDGDLVVDHAVDHIFNLKPALKHEFALLDPGLRRAIALASAGNTRTVVWNPGPDDPIDDQMPDDWHHFICVEPVSDWPNGRTLGAGETVKLEAAIQAHLENA